MFWHRLALLIGGCTVAELKDRITANEARQWRLFLKITGPMGYERDDWNFALLRKMILYVKISPEDRQEPEVFLLEFTNKKSDTGSELTSNVVKLAGLAGL